MNDEMNKNESPYFHDSKVVSHLRDIYSSSKTQSDEVENSFANYLEWLNTAPKYSTYRVNTSITTSHEAKNMLEKVLREDARYGNVTSEPDIAVHPSIPDLLVVGPIKTSINVSSPVKCEVIVDSVCGAAVLRGAHVFAPGVLGMSSEIRKHDLVGVWADLDSGCRRGLKKDYEGRKVYVGHGIALLTRRELFAENNHIKGVAIQITCTVSGCISLPIGCEILISSPSPILLQNLPSVLCSWALNPQPGQLILDACAAPGNKTTHLAALMKNEGLIIALDKISSKISLIEHNCSKMSATNVKVYAYDTTKAVIDPKESANPTSPFKDPPPYFPNTFDKVLLDVPCSALGQRPQLANKIKLSQLKSYPALQRRLFKSAVSLVKVGGHILYSTCTITTAENEDMVSWALKTFPNIRLEAISPEIGYIGGRGWPVQGLSLEDRQKVIRFGPPED
ncbi:hypothetical protein J437_LFUL008500, partial [Ladona fulva]